MRATRQDVLRRGGGENAVARPGYSNFELLRAADKHLERMSWLVEMRIAWFVYPYRHILMTAFLPVVTHIRWIYYSRY